MTSNPDFTVSRRAALLGLMALSVAASTQPATSHRTSPRVLFICQAGTVKSAIARELFRKRARERGIEATAFSRGIVPEDHLSPALRAHLSADGIDTSGDQVRKLEADDLKAADIVVFFNPLPPGLADSDALDWSSVPSVNDSYESALVNLDRRIEALLDGIVERRAK